jgi:hypothetical protein
LPAKITNPLQIERMTDVAARACVALNADLAKGRTERAMMTHSLRSRHALLPSSFSFWILMFGHWTQFLILQVIKPSFDLMLVRPRTHQSNHLSPHHSQHHTRVPFRPRTLAFPPSTTVVCGRACDVALLLPAIQAASARYVPSLTLYHSSNLLSFLVSLQSCASQGVQSVSEQRLVFGGRSTSVHVTTDSNHVSFTPYLDECLKAAAERAPALVVSHMHTEQAASTPAVSEATTADSTSVEPRVVTSSLPLHAHISALIKNVSTTLKTPQLQAAGISTNDVDTISAQLLQFAQVH